MPTSMLPRLPLLSLLCFVLGGLLLFAGGEPGLLSPAAGFFVLGMVLLMFSLASFVIYLIFSLMRDHTVWRAGWLDD